MSDHDGADGWFGAAKLPPWQATGLSLAVIAGFQVNGLGALLFGVVAVGVIWTLGRLHAHAPGAQTTADLIASAPGAAPARAVSIVQFAAYTLIAAYVARTAAQICLLWTTGPDMAVSVWAVPALAVAAAAAAALAAGLMPTRVLAPLATALAAFGLLVFFYVAIAVIAKIASGTPPIAPMIDLSAKPSPSGWGQAALLLVLALPFTGFEIPTTASDRLRVVGRPLGIAVGLVVLCAVTGVVAVNIASIGDFRYDAANLTPLASQMFGEWGGVRLLLAATTAQAVAALLVLAWGAKRVVAPYVEQTSPWPVTATAVVTMVVAWLVSTDWLGSAEKLWGASGVLLIAVYVLAAHANSRLDDSSTVAWALFAAIGFALLATVVLKGADTGWWPIGIAMAVGAVAAAIAVKRPESPTPRPHRPH